jgi:hypothetical protein
MEIHMSAYYSAPITIHQNVPWNDMLPIERYLLTLFFGDSAAYNKHGPIDRKAFNPLDILHDAEIFLASEVGVSNHLTFKPGDVRTALALSTKTPEAAGRVASVLLKIADQTGKGDDKEVDAEVDDREAFNILQEIIARSKTLQYLTAEQAFYSSEIERDAFGGSASVITSNTVFYMDTAGVIAKQLEKLGFKPEASPSQSALGGF